MHLGSLLFTINRGILFNKSYPFILCLLLNPVIKIIKLTENIKAFSGILG